MNTTTSVPTPAALAAAFPARTDSLESAEQEISNLRTQLELAEEKKANIQKSAKEALYAAIASIPGLLGVASLKESIALLSRESQAKHHPHRLSIDTLRRMRLMFGSHQTSARIATLLGVGVSTVDACKAKWGLTRHYANGSGGSGQAALATLKRHVSNNSHIAPSKRAQIVAALGANGTSIANIAKRFGVSRQTCYSLRAATIQFVSPPPAPQSPVAMAAAAAAA